MVRLRQFNAGFKSPMTEKELQQTVCTAQRKAGYQYSNEKLIALLGITEEEQSVIGLFAVPQHRPNATRDEVRKALREGRDSKIVELHESGISQSEIARQLKINRKTVARVLKDFRASNEVEQTEETIDQGGNVSNFGSINDCLIGEEGLVWEEEEEVYIQEGQSDYISRTEVPDNMPSSMQKKWNRSILVLPRPGPS